MKRREKEMNVVNMEMKELDLNAYQASGDWHMGIDPHWMGLRCPGSSFCFWS